MMIAIISDIHGNYPALKAVLHEIDRIGCETILSLGDVSGYYCMINECVDALKKRNVTNLLGNHDAYLLGRGKCPRSMTANLCIAYQKKIITDSNLEYISCSLSQLDNALYSARHGGWNDPIDEYIDQFDFSVSSRIPVKIFLSGHSHVQKLQTMGDRVYCNPGAVGQPRDNDPRAAFAVIKDGRVELCRVEYDIDEIVQTMKKAGFEDRISNCLYSGTKIKTYGT